MSDVIFTSRADEVLKELDGAIELALEAIGMTAETYAKQETPVDTGRLRNSMSHTVQPSENAVYIGSNVEYAPYIELGTRNIRARNMLRNAATQHSDEYKQLTKQALNNR